MTWVMTEESQQDDAPAPNRFPGGRVRLPTMSATITPERGPQVAFVGTAFVRASEPPVEAPRDQRGGAFQEYFTYESLFEEPPEEADTRNPYSMLGVSGEATWTEIVVAHRRLARQFHPDQFVDADAAVRAEAEDRIRDINWAYNTLRDWRRQASS